MKNQWLRNFLVGLVGAVVIALGISIVTATSATTNFFYSLPELGVLPHKTSSAAYGINDRGQVVGSSYGGEPALANTAGKQTGDCSFPCKDVADNVSTRVENQKEQAVTQNQFVGTWRLISWENRAANGQVVYPYGKDASGYLMYSQEGYMSVVIMTANRPKFATRDIWGGSAQEKAAAIETYLSYGGKYEIQGNKVIHHVEVSLFPNWIGVDQERFFELTGDRLSLSTPPFQVSGKQQTAHLIWKRV